MKDENEQGLDTGEDWSGDGAGRPIDAVERSGEKMKCIQHRSLVKNSFSLFDLERRNMYINCMALQEVYAI